MWLAPLLALAGLPSDDRCANLLELPIEQVTVDSAVAAGGTCRVMGIARPEPGSNVRFAVYLPALPRWSGRYYQTGNGGLGGAIHIPTLEEGARRGDAVSATDTGHVGHGFDASWADGKVSTLANYGWRSIKITSDVAQQLMFAFYGRHPHHRYFMGCSNGGRMALMAAARWPSDWDGIIAGAPANPWTTQLRNFGKIQDAVRRQGASFGLEELGLIRRTAQAACPRDSVMSGIPQHPDRCRPDWRNLLCSRNQKSGCLSPDQLGSLDEIIKAGYEPAAMIPQDWRRWIVNPDVQAMSQLTFAQQARRYIFANFGDATLASHLDVRPTELQAFRERGGKVLSYFGWADAVIAPGLGIEWYSAVRSQTHSPTKFHDFYRLFMVPGMTHCQGGEGAVSFGQSLEAQATAQDPEHDLRLALERWVELGVAPNVLRSRTDRTRNTVRAYRTRY